jgi:ferredoxin-NADP reductase
MTGGPGWQNAQVVGTEALSDSSRRIELLVDGWHGSLPGQHVDVRLTAEDGYQAVRSYSLASTGKDPVIELGVDRLPDGEVSPYLVDELQVDDQLEVRGPLGGWFVWHQEDHRPVQLVAGGSGVVPLVAMIRARAMRMDGPPFRLLYSVRSPSRALFRDLLQQPPRDTTVNWIYTRQPPAGWPRPARRLDADDLDDYAFGVEEAPVVFVCGSTPFAEQVSQLLLDRGHPSDMIRIERYGGI